MHHNTHLSTLVSVHTSFRLSSCHLSSSPSVPPQRQSIWSRPPECLGELSVCSPVYWFLAACHSKTPNYVSFTEDFSFYKHFTGNLSMCIFLPEPCQLMTLAAGREEMVAKNNINWSMYAGQRQAVNIIRD